MLDRMFPFAIVLVSVAPFVDTVATCLIILPIPNIGIIIQPFPHAKAILAAKLPLPFVCFPIVPSIYTFTMRLVILVLAHIPATLGKLLGSFSMSLIVFPLAFIYSAIVVDLYSQTMLFLVVVYLASVCVMFILFDGEVVLLHQLLEIEFVGEHHIV